MPYSIVTADVEVWEKEGVEEDFEEYMGKPDESHHDVDSSYSLVLWLVHFLALLHKKHCLPSVGFSPPASFLSLFINILDQISPQLAGISRHYPSTTATFGWKQRNNCESCDLSKVL